MNINSIKTEIETTCDDRDFNRTVMALGIAISAGKSMKDQPGYEELERTATVATLWVKTIGTRVESIGKLITALMKQSETDGYPDVTTAAKFVNEVDELKKYVKWDTIDPNFYQNTDLIYQLMKPYVENEL